MFQETPSDLVANPLSEPMDTSIHQRPNEIATMIHAFQKLFSLGVTLIALQGVTPNATAPTEQQPLTPSVPQPINPSQFKWQKTIPQLRKKAQAYAILHKEKETGLSILMFRTPVAVHIKPHRHQRAETHLHQSISVIKSSLSPQTHQPSRFDFQASC